MFLRARLSRPFCRIRPAAGAWRHWLAVVLAATGLIQLSGGQALAIDAHRPLTQSLQRIWQMQQGLPAAPIMSLLQTRDGYLWLGTQKGLYRFDGIHFTTPRAQAGAGLEDLWIQDLAEDADRNLWIATDGAGLIRLRDGLVRRFTTESGLPSNDVRRVLVDRNHSIWVATDAGLACLDPPQLEREAGLVTVTVRSSENLRALCQAEDGKIWAGGDGNELVVWDGKQIGTQRIESLSAHDVVNSLLSTPDGTLWIGSSNGLVRLRNDTEHRFATADGLADDNVLCLAAGNDGVLWVGTHDGFSRLVGDEIESFDTRDGLSQSTVYSVCEDREGSLWVGTKHGLNEFLDRRTQLYTTREGLPSNDAGPVLQDSLGDVWVGTIGAGLGRFDGRRFAVLTAADGLTSNTIYALADGGQGRLWIGTDAGLNMLVDGHVEAAFGTDQGLPSAVVYCLCRDRRGTLWAGTSAGLAQLQDDRFVEPEGEASLLRVPIRALVEHGDGQLVAATQSGKLLRCVDGQCTPLADGALNHWNVDTLFEDADGLLWMGTQGHGLLLLDGDKTFHFTTKTGLYDDDIFGIVVDDQDRLWMACSKGIFFVERAALRQFAAGQITTLTNTPFTPMDALRTIECKGGVQPSLCKLQDGSVWFSTIRGLIVIDPSRLRRKLPPVPVIVEDVIVNGKNEIPDQVSRLSPGQTNLEFRYTALSFVTPTRTTFRYKLDGFDKDWIDAGSRREAFYTNLPPGHYRFQLEARLHDAKWQPAERSVDFTLEPHFYQTGWFGPLCAALLVLAGWVAYRLRVRRIKQHLQLVVAERSRIARELHDTLMQGFSGVTMEMQALSARLAPSPERRTLEEIIRDAGVCLREARRSVAGLRNSRGDETGLSAAIAQAAKHLTETQDVRLKLDLQRSPPSLPDDVQYNLLRIAQEAVSNAVKHSGGRTIEVGLDCSAERLRLTIQDDGVGLGPPDGNRLQPGHYGLIGMRERASQIGAVLHLSSGNGRGTTVCVELPIAGGGLPSDAGGPGLPVADLPPSAGNVER